MLRAKMAMHGADALQIDQNAAIRWAAAIEVLHNASLVHDDICDEDSKRRGKTSLWKEFGVPAAVCTGDYISSEDMTNAYLSGADLSGAYLRSADLSGAYLTGANLYDAYLSGVTWYNTICPDGTNSDNNGNTCENNL